MILSEEGFGNKKSSDYLTIFSFVVSLKSSLLNNIQRQLLSLQIKQPKKYESYTSAIEG
jgi:hypothetical protein